MIEYKVQKEELFLAVKDFADALGLCVIEVHKDQKSALDVHLSFTVAKIGGEVSIDECETFHRAVLPSLEIKYGREALSMDVSTPGILRNIKDLYEFTVFNGRYCRVYSSLYSSWIEGTITDFDGSVLTLNSYKIVDTSETGDFLKINTSEIQKAKLEYKWETAEDKKRKNVEKQKTERRKNKVQENIK